MNNWSFKWMRFLPDRIVNNAVTLGRIGYLGKAPGTNGSLVGILLYTLFFHQLTPFGQGFFFLLLVVFAISFCDEGERRLRKLDPGEMILDEVIAVPLCFFGLRPLMEQTGHVWAYMIVGFLLFRLFDILKPFGIKRLQDLGGGLGVVLDDLAAALVVNIILRFAVFL